MRRDIITWANEVIPIVGLLYDRFGIRVPPEASSWKTFCPFGFEHEDGGKDKAFRVFPATNSAFCFDVHGSLTSVKIVALAKDVSLRQAALGMLREAGKLDDRPWAERWVELQAELNTPKSPEVGDTAELVEALHTALRSHPYYPAGGLSPTLLDGIDRCLVVLDRLVARGASADQLTQWYEGSKTRLLAALDEEGSRESSSTGS